MNRKGIPVELLNELFGSLPFENAFNILAKMQNGLLARNVQRMINGIKAAMENNKLNEDDCSPNLRISADGLVTKHSGSTKWNRIRTILPIPSFNLPNINKPTIIFYFEMQTFNKSTPYSLSNGIGICSKYFPSEGILGKENNSIGIWGNGLMWIDGSVIKFGTTIGYLMEGDFVGIGIIQQPNSRLECFATLNGKLLGKVELPLKFTTLEFFPVVALYREGNPIRTNFVKEKWQFKEFERVIQ